MANDIIRQLRAATTATNRTATIEGVTIDKTWCQFDTFSGTPAALIAAGLITADQIPGQPGMPKVSATFYNGVRCDDKGGCVPRDSGYLNICKNSGKKVTVKVGGIPDDEKAARRAAGYAELMARRVAQSKREELPKVALSELDYRKIAADLVMCLWRLASTEDRSNADDFPYELPASTAKSLLDPLRQVLDVFRSSSLQLVSPDRANLDKARKDDAFQAFLRLQCISVDGESHA